MAAVNEQTRQVLIQGYRNELFLAAKLKRIFFRIESESDRAIHNDMYDDLLVLIAGKREELLLETAKLIMGYMR
ncbi:MAG: hypothetical protein MUO27_00890 [Sedimentisphaerales bacterium]|nr:hypothetical protein [Sedimentisphaerales bacterium]